MTYDWWLTRDLMRSDAFLASSSWLTYVIAILMPLLTNDKAISSPIPWRPTMRATCFAGGKGMWPRFGEGVGARLAMIH